MKKFWRANVQHRTYDEQYCILCLQYAKRVSLKCPYHKNSKKEDGRKLRAGMDRFMALTVGSFHRCIPIPQCFELYTLNISIHMSKKCQYTEEWSQIQAMKNDEVSKKVKGLST